MAKELIKDNVVEAPTLFVGVGGTGSGIVQAVAEMCKPGELENINFVCMDTNVNDLSGVAKSGAHIYTVQTSNTQTVGGYLDYDQDALRNWFPKNAVLYDKTVSEGAGQVRAISRLALNSTIKTGKIRPLQNAIDDLFRKTGKAMKQAMRCVLVSTASGGTGSGILLPLAMYIRDYVKNKYPNTSLIVRSLVMLPETLDSVIDSSVERDSQRRNAYATIKEINAFMMKGSGFFDIDEDLKRYSNLHLDFTNPGTDELRSLSLLPFDFCFLLDGQNAEDSTLVSLKQYKTQAAQALYEQNIGPMQKKAFSVEDNIIKEMSNPGNYGRNRFGGIGAGVIRYPYEDIADYIAYDWAIDSIGSEEDSSKWRRYDNAYERKRKEGIKKGLSETELPKRGEVYISELANSGDPFSRDLRAKYLGEADMRVMRYMEALAEHMHESLNENSRIKDSRDAANHLSMEIDYTTDDSNHGKAQENLDLLRSYASMVKQNAKKAAESGAEAVFYNETKTIVEKAPYSLEALLKNARDEICHPNAARYMLYMVRSALEGKIEETYAEINNVILTNLESYAPDANDSSTFNAKHTKKNEKNIDELCAVEKAAGQDPSILEKWRNYSSIYDAYNNIFPDYFNNITEYGNKTAELVAYQVGLGYVKELCSVYEAFYKTFPEKVSTMVRRQDELVDALAFTKGDSVLNICATRPLLQELSRSTTSMSEEGSMLDSELNGQIFDAVKANVRFEREIRNADIVEDDRRIDIFDQILLGYFKNSVRRTCDSINVNIVEAIAKENRLLARIKQREQQNSTEKVFDKVSREQNERYIKEIIAMGERLSAPGIQRITNEESREVRLCAYNKCLTEMRAFRVEDLLPKGDAVDTISKYELHFFNALYNLTPNKLKKFASPFTTETGAKEAGLYHTAYFNYARHIGPDSTKNMMISTHIDKRWDSIAVMPEMDFGFQNSRMMKIHQAMIYGLVHGMIRRHSLSQAASGKKVYKYENSDERYVDLVVSNGTLCDEFYEILNALYISSAIVEDVEVIKRRRRARDEVRNSNYRDTMFAKDLSTFFIGDLHEGRTSLFEIPMAYYNSLPNSQRFAGELSSLVDAVIKTLRDELNTWERGNDAKFILCEVLVEQFKLLMENYKIYPKLSNNFEASDHPVISIIYRRLKKVLCEAPEPDDYEETLRIMKEMIG